MSGSLILRADNRLKVFENRVITGMCGPKREEVTGWGEVWRKLHNEKLHNLYYSPDTIK
jgi:hypothetical protein